MSFVLSAIQEKIKQESVAIHGASGWGRYGIIRLPRKLSDSVEMPIFPEPRDSDGLSEEEIQKVKHFARFLMQAVDCLGPKKQCPVQMDENDLVDTQRVAVFLQRAANYPDCRNQEVLKQFAKVLTCKN